MFRQISCLHQKQYRELNEVDEHPDLVSNSILQHSTVMKPLCFMATASSKPIRNAEIFSKEGY